MAFKLKSALNFGQKSSFKMRGYSPNKQEEGELSKKPPMSRLSKRTLDRKLKDYLMDQKGFNQADADRMIKDGAYSYKDMIKDLSPRKNSPNKQKDRTPGSQNPNFPETVYTKDGKAVKSINIDEGQLDLLPSIGPKGKFVNYDQGDGTKIKYYYKNPKKGSSLKQTSQDDFKPAYPGADYSKEDIAKMTRKEKEMKIDGYDPALDPTQPEYKKRKQLKDPKSPMKGYKSDAQRKAVHASKADGGKGNPNKMKKSPNKQKKKYPKSYTKKDIKFLKEQREDIVRREDLDEKGKKIFDRNKAKTIAKKSKKSKKRSPNKMDPMTAMALASSLKGAKDKDDKKGLDIVSMAPSAMKKNKKK